MVVNGGNVYEATWHLEPKMLIGSGNATMKPILMTVDVDHQTQYASRADELANTRDTGIAGISGEVGAASQRTSGKEAADEAPDSIVVQHGDAVLERRQLSIAQQQRARTRTTTLAHCIGIAAPIGGCVNVCMRLPIYLSHERETNDDDTGSGASHQATRDKNQSTKVGARATTRAHEE